MERRCQDCGRGGFRSEQALQQHVRDSPAHHSNFHCVECERGFSGEQALKQHLRDAPAHKASYDCVQCNRSFETEERLQHHVRDSPAHKPSFDCVECERRFRSEEALQQHKRDVHEPEFYCTDCDRGFKSEEALQQHLRDSPAHQPSLDCVQCNRSFNSEVALQNHLQDSPAHKPSYDCIQCNRTYRSEEALQQHIRSSLKHKDPVPINTTSSNSPPARLAGTREGHPPKTQPHHQQGSRSAARTAPQHRQRQPTQTPLDRFFTSFPGFEYDPTLPPSVSFANLRRKMNWRRNEDDSDEGWDRYQSALEAELEMWFGKEDDLENWHALCRAVGIKPIPETVGGCEKALRKVYVNIIDLIDTVRHGDGKEVKWFSSLEDLREYSIEEQKIFRNTMGEGEDGDGDAVLRHLLRKLFRGGRGYRG